VDGFYGLVGDFAVSVEADRTRAKVGDPILLRIRVRGDGILDMVERPILSRVEEFAGFKVDDNLAPGERDDDSILFEQKIRPRSADVTEIPPVPLPYFNFVTGDYEVARSEPIPIDVLPTDVVTAEDIEGRGGANPPYVEKAELEEKSGGLNSNYLYLDALEDHRIEVARIVWVLAAPIGYLLVAAAMAMRRSRRADVAGLRARGARKAALKEIDRIESSGTGASDSEFHESLSRTVQRFFTDRFALGEGEITAVEIERLREEGRIPGPTGEETIRILEACAAGRFGAGGGAGSAREELLSRIRRLIREVAS
jgi:hypothetical protein